MQTMHFPALRVHSNDQTFRSAGYEAGAWKSELGSALPVMLTQFELQVERLGLSKTHYVASPELKRWCERNRNRCYVPEWLLKEWGIEVDAILSGVAS
jgi:hypothetical protein